ncbi:transcription antitermination factor NusB [Sedimentisphaera salicampi]|uniref:transcription antitermination factor NusB n=1 Tax=Sedimentisphaera salicampi TaxID=1941349 RepID=UPI000B9B1C03|nr:transcription antitermination factor NusB [Sedimentisphaera salicampi]OXU14095.1 transcription antitermination factor NusB [Sedimentisphaera salicampi]
MTERKKLHRKTEGREIAMQLLFQLEQQSLLIQSEAPGKTVPRSGWSRNELIRDFAAQNARDNFTAETAKKWVYGVIENLKTCDEMVGTVLKKWSVERVMPLERAVIRLCVYQIIFCDEIPPKVAINEGVEMAKKFGTSHSSKFVNGVLDAVYKRYGQTEENEAAYENNINT